jgi:hypothetical protein
VKLPATSFNEIDFVPIELNIVAAIRIGRHGICIKI